MSFIAAAIIGSAVVGGVASASASSKAAKAQKAANQVSADAAQAQLDFEKERYDRFLSIYGDVEENLGEFYNNLSPDVFIRTGLESQQKEYAKARNDITTSLAQRGLGRSGVEADLMARTNIAEAQGKAQIRREAPFQVAAAKEGFVRGGKDPSSGVSSALQNQGNVLSASAQANADRLSGTASGLWSTTGKLLSSGITYGLNNGFGFGGTPTANTGYAGSTQGASSLAADFANQPINLIG